MRYGAPRDRVHPKRASGGCRGFVTVPQPALRYARATAAASLQDARDVNRNTKTSSWRKRADMPTLPLFLSAFRVLASAPSYSLMKPPATSSARCFSNSLYGAERAVGTSATLAGSVLPQRKHLLSQKPHRHGGIGVGSTLLKGTTHKTRGYALSGSALDTRTRYKSLEDRIYRPSPPTTRKNNTFPLPRRMTILIF